MPNYFKAYSPNKDALKTTGDLQTWLKDYVAALFPDNGIEYWADNASSPRDCDLKPASDWRQYVAGNGDKSFTNVACFYHSGHCEGRILKAGIITKTGTFMCIAWAKVFGSTGEMTTMTSAITEALEAIFVYDELPLLPELYRKLPRRHSFGAPDVKEPLQLRKGPTAIELIDNDNVVLDTRTFADDPYAESRLQAIQADWWSILRRGGIAWTNI